MNKNPEIWFPSLPTKTSYGSTYFFMFVKAISMEILHLMIHFARRPHDINIF